MSETVVRARFLFPVTSPPIADGVLAVRDGKIVAVNQNPSGAPVRDLGSVAILPGLVNAHTHLEFSELARPLGAPGMPFVDWIRAVVTHRRSAGEPLDNAAANRSRAVALGMSESAAAGVVALGEIATPGWPEEPLLRTHLDVTIFLELLGLRLSRMESLHQLGSEHLAAPFRGECLRPGLSPHAPYTVPFELLQRICKLSAGTGAPVAMHLAESRDELELLASHSGPFAELLREFDAWDPGAIPRGVRPLDYLRELSGAARALVVHGNYLVEAELALLAQHRDRMSLVYCPRTHAYFAHGTYPLRRALQLGVNVALGTDSRASNPDLSLWRELLYVAQAFPEIAPDDVLRLGTHNGAVALGIEAKFGSLEVGKRASLCLVPLAEGSTTDPYELLFSPQAASATPWSETNDVSDRV